MCNHIKVLHTIASLVPETGGPARSVTGLCNTLADRNIEVQLASLDLGKQFAAPMRPASRQVTTTLVPRQVALGLRQIWVPQFQQTLSSLVSRGEIQIIHDHGLWEPSNQAAAQTAVKYNLPLIISPRGTLEPWARRQKFVKKQVAWYLYQRRNLARATVLHATSVAEAEHLRQLNLRQPIALIPNGLELPAMPAAKSNKPTLGMKTILFLSRIHPVKGLLNLVEAMRLAQLQGWRVVIAGPDSNGHQAEVQAAIHAAGLDSLFTFVGAVDDHAKWALYQQADLFVQPSFSENFGISIAEALASGVPAIATQATPWAELEKHQCGWWVSVGAEPLAQALREATQLDDSCRQQMGQNGRLLIEKKYTWPAIAEQMTAVYRWILQKDSKPACIV